MGGSFGALYKMKVIDIPSEIFARDMIDIRAVCIAYCTFVE